MQVPDVGQTFHGRYALRERLGDGGTATVFRADDLELGRTVAIKVYGPESELSDMGRRQREARALAGVRHPAIVTLFDARLDATPPYLVLELVDGETLAQRIARGPLSGVEMRAIGSAAASGLAAAHDVGIVHRDVKPANIMIPAGPAQDEARLLDFGIAHSIGGSRVTTSGTVVGSAVYLSPEQARGDAVTPASDIYSLGLVLIECLTGRPAFTGTTAEVLGARLVRAPALDDPAVAADAPLLSRMTSLEPADRPTAGDVVQLLEGPAATRVLAAGGSAVGAASAGAASVDVPTQQMTQASSSPPPRTPRRVPLAVIVGGVGGLLVTVLVVAALFAALPGLAPVPPPTDSPSPDVAVVTPSPDETADDEAPGNSGNAPGNTKNDKDDGKKP